MTISFIRMLMGYIMLQEKEKDGLIRGFFLNFSLIYLSILKSTYNLLYIIPILRI